MKRSVVSQRWPVAGNGEVLLTLFTDAPSADAIALLGPVVEAIEAYQSAMAELVQTQRASDDTKVRVTRSDGTVVLVRRATHSDEQDEHG